MRNESAPFTPHLRVHQDRGHTVLEFHGEIDIIAALDIVPALDAATGHPAARVVLDLRHIEFFDCSACGCCTAPGAGSSPRAGGCTWSAPTR